MYEPRTTGFAVEGTRLGNELIVQLGFKPNTRPSETYLKREVKKHKTPFPHKMDSFLKRMLQFNNIGNGRVDVIQVYMINEPQSVDNEYLSSRYFTLGLRSVGTGERHVFKNFTVDMPIYVANCHRNLPDYERIVNTSKIFVDDALVRHDFDIHRVDSGGFWWLDEGSIYFMYTVAQSYFSVTSVPMNSEPVTYASTSEPMNSEPATDASTSEPMNSELATDASTSEPMNSEPATDASTSEPMNSEPATDALSVCEVQMQGLSSPCTSDASNTSCTLLGTGPGIFSTSSPNTVSGISPIASPASSPATSVSTQPERYEFELETSSDINIELSWNTRKASN